MAFIPSSAAVLSSTRTSSSTTTCKQSKLAAPASRRHYAHLNSISMNAAKAVTFPELDGSKFRVGIVSSRWNADLVDAMGAEVKKTLIANKVKEDNIIEIKVPGSWEIPQAARYITVTQKLDAIVCLGVLVKGETNHYEYICDAVSKALMNLQINTAIPIVFGILTCQTQEQADARAKGNKSHAADWARSAVEMAMLRASQMGKAEGEQKTKIGFGGFVENPAKEGGPAAPKERKIGFN
eukprot:CAMPEP_0184706952 /NCGR_PEP_ID=MMETSP0313-20130426/37026_1 /TAXON_ID=2792 /ORGANISM="Porphyridium aerugineum, Strain SAG 1380-2" /LENGTH=238 /DNA_ID=CAMNT_0027168521 /DNA_START=45 /DNA_END=761 /DNA_ORIENTATION=+